MSHLIAISGPSSTGKTTLFESLKNELGEVKNVYFYPNFCTSVWEDLVAQGVFYEFSEIQKDREYMTIFILKMIEKYDSLVSEIHEDDSLSIFDGCWADLFVYANLQMWYNRFTKALQEEVLLGITRFINSIDKFYVTRVDEEEYPLVKRDMRSTLINLKQNRELEIGYYELVRKFNNALSLPTLQVRDSVKFIVDDIKKEGYLA